VLLIIPVFLPIVKRLPIDEIGFIGQLEPSQISIWFGVLFCMNMQVSFLSPPFGPAAFYLKSVAPAHISLTDIFRGFLPFICVQLIAITVLLVWPSIVTILLYWGGGSSERMLCAKVGDALPSAKSQILMPRITTLLMAQLSHFCQVIAGTAKPTIDVEDAARTLIATREIETLLVQHLVQPNHTKEQIA
jgi:hypothetical protein